VIPSILLPYPKHSQARFRLQSRGASVELPAPATDRLDAVATCTSSAFS